MVNIIAARFTGLILPNYTPLRVLDFAELKTPAVILVTMSHYHK